MKEKSELGGDWVGTGIKGEAVRMSLGQNVLVGELRGKFYRAEEGTR